MEGGPALVLRGTLTRQSNERVAGIVWTSDAALVLVQVPAHAGAHASSWPPGGGSHH